MKKSEAIEVGCKLLSIYAFMHGLTALGLPVSLHVQAISMRTTILRGNTALLGITFVPAVLLFLFSGVLGLSARRIKLGAEGEPSSESVPGVTPQIIQSIVFSAVGILVLVESIAPLANTVVLVRAYRENYYLDMSFYYHTVEGLIKLGIGLWLLLGSKSLLRFKSWLLTVGQKDR
jgi:hypothetical protein